MHRAEYVGILSYHKKRVGEIIIHWLWFSTRVNSDQGSRSVCRRNLKTNQRNPNKEEQNRQWRQKFATGDLQKETKWGSLLHKVSIKNKEILRWNNEYKSFKMAFCFFCLPCCVLARLSALFSSPKDKRLNLHTESYPLIPITLELFLLPTWF